MTATMLNEAKFSKFTLALLEDSGWYKGDYNLTDKLTWGEGNGCDFANKACQSDTEYKEFCTNFDTPETSCDEHGDITQYCDFDDFSDNCFYWRDSYAGLLEPDEKCFVIQEMVDRNHFITTTKDFKCTNNTSIKFVF